ncbi:cytochrome P450 [Bradyrhizobium sp. BR 10289]|uniref:cytochrome P450 n=1 Tax=Bradyrhizobium sp. BR 10289 TaxID=2749993 RepID=UPI001C64D06B|nr:cytochrome P450 [Bradyrhizobium sp. BR 10289]MBW7970207.1 cytochrome P450 [Bradyrhizobium sp. BR 10289]
MLTYEVDLYADDAILEPYGHYKAIRDLGPAVFLPKHDMWCLGRYDEVRAALRDYSTFSSAQGVAANDVINTRSLGNTITTDPPEHNKMRRIIKGPLAAPALTHIATAIDEEAERLVDRLVRQKSFDGITECAQHLPVTIVSKMVGLPEGGRANMLRWASATFDALGTMNERGKEALPHIEELHRYCTDERTLGALSPEGWAAAIWRAAEDGHVPRSKCPAMMRDYISPSLDTTILATGSLLWLFGQFPEQWEKVRSDASLIPGAINEAIRLESPIRGFTRVTTRELDYGGQTIPAWSRILLLYASANRDERKWSDPETFDVTRDARDHLGFGFGPHVCVGMHLAKLEMTALVKAFARHVASFELGEAKRATNNTLRGFARLPITVH